jgi:hypothetical protein
MVATRCLFVFIGLISLTSNFATAASIPVLTSEPANPENYFRINVVGFNQLNADSAGLFYARGDYSSADLPTYAPLDDAGDASFWLPAPIDASMDSIQVLVSMNLPDWQLWSGGYIEDADTWRMFVPIAPDVSPDFNLDAATTLTISMSPPSFASEPDPAYQRMLVGMSLSADNDMSKALLFDWALRAVPEPISMALLATGAISMAGLRRRRV